jgi:hypothetical protein
MVETGQGQATRAGWATGERQGIGRAGVVKGRGKVSRRGETRGHGRQQGESWAGATGRQGSGQRQRRARGEKRQGTIYLSN